MLNENTTIAERISYIRNQLDLTQKDLAKILNVRQSTISSIERNINNPSRQFINNIIRELGINKKWLETGQGPMKKNNKEILEQAINLINDLPATEKAFLELMENKLQDQNKEKATFYRLLHSLLETYQQADRDTQGYIIIQLRKSFSELLEE